MVRFGDPDGLLTALLRYFTTVVAYINQSSQGTTTNIYSTSDMASCL